MSTMDALVFLEPNRMEVRQRPLHQPGEGEVRIRVAFAGICGSDIHGYSGETGRRYPDTVMGHEASGVVESVGSGVDEALVGTRVTFNPIVACDGECGHDTPNRCEQLRLIGVHHGLDGAFAPYTVVAADRILPIGDMSFQQAAMAEPLAVAIRTARTIVDGTGPLLVIGSGMIGVAVALAARSLGIEEVVLSDRDPNRLAVAERLGFTTVSSDDVPGGAFRRVVDAVGSQGSIDAAIAATRRGSLITVVGLGDRRVTLAVQDLVGAERRFTGSFSFSDEDFADGVALAATVDHETLVTVIPLEDGPAALADLVAGRRSDTKIMFDLRA